MIKDSNVSHEKISHLIWPIFRDEDSCKLKNSFYEFLIKYAKDPTNLEEWPIVRIFEIWCK
jgi:hypothetical protein